MNAAALEEHIVLQIGSLELEGLIDDKLRLCHAMKKDSGPYFLLELMKNFLADVRIGLNDMTRTLNQPAVDYDHLYQLFYKLKGSVTCIGASKMVLSCSTFRQALDIGSKDGCVSALDCVKQDFSELRSKLDTLIEMEMRILSQKYI